MCDDSDNAFEPRNTQNTRNTAVTCLENHSSDVRSPGFSLPIGFSSSNRQSFVCFVYFVVTKILIHSRALNFRMNHKT